MTTNHTTTATATTAESETTMKTTLNTNEIANLLRNDENANWSYTGARALAAYLENIETETGTEIEFDLVAIRCDFSEYDSLQDWAMEYHGTSELLEACEACSVDEDDAMSGDDEGIDSAIREYIEYRGQLVEFDGGVIVSSF